MPYTRTDREAIQAAANTLEGLQRIVQHDLRDQLQKVGNQWRARSPFVGPEGDRNPSFYIFLGRRGDYMFKCHSTGRGGNWWNFLEFIRPHSTDQEKYEIAAQRLNVGPAIIADRAEYEPLQCRTVFFPVEEAADRCHYYVEQFESYVIDMFGGAGTMAMARFGIGSDCDGWTNFWHIDCQWRVHGVKRAKFRLNDHGKPTKKDVNGKAQIHWKWPANHKEPNTWTPVFGEQTLIGASPDVVYIVESEDSAVLLTADCIQRGEEALVLAAGGKAGYLNLFERLGVARMHMADTEKLQRYILIPDADHGPTEENPYIFEALKEAAYRHAMINLEVMTLHELTRFAPYRDQIGPKWDIGDVFHAMFHPAPSKATTAPKKRTTQKT